MAHRRVRQRREEPDGLPADDVVRDVTGTRRARAGRRRRDVPTGRRVRANRRAEVVRGVRPRTSGDEGAQGGEHVRLFRLAPGSSLRVSGLVSRQAVCGGRRLREDVRRFLLGPVVRQCLRICSHAGHDRR